MTLSERVYKKSFDKNLAAAARSRASLPKYVQLEQAEFKKSSVESPSQTEEKHKVSPRTTRNPSCIRQQSRAPLCSDKKSKKWTPAIVKNRVSRMMKTQNILTCNSRRDRVTHTAGRGARPAKRGSWSGWKSVPAACGKTKWFNGTP